jgi:hypothetical protein
MAEAVRARNQSVKRGHPKYTANVTSEEECTLTEGVLALLDENERLRRDRDSYANSDFERQLCDVRGQLAGAEAANAATTGTLVEHSTLNGHIDIAEQCRDYLVHEATDDPSGKLQDFVESLRMVIDQLDRQRRSRNWYEVAYSAGKQKLIEYALSKVCCAGEPHTFDQEAIAAAEGKTDRLIEQLAAMTAARDEAIRLLERLAVRDPMDLTCVVCGGSMFSHPSDCRLANRICELKGVGR